MRAIWRRYGAGPGHLLATVASFAIATAAVIGWTQRPKDLMSVLVWFVAAILLHDMVLLPLYTLADRVTIGFLPVRAAVYVRVPVIISALLLAAVFPTVLGYGGRSTFNLSGIAEHGYFIRWLIVTGVLFALSGLAYALRGRETATR
jgi:hypothetical protein